MFLNDYQYTLRNTGTLTRVGAGTEFQRGAAIWNLYGKDLYGETAALASAKTKPFVRSASSSHVRISVPYWMEGFMGVPQDADALSMQTTMSGIDCFIISEGEDQNNTLASYDTCVNANVAPISELGEMILERYIPLYLQDAHKRLGPQSPSEFALSTNDLYAMQFICAFETNAFGSSPFCSLFTSAEWAAFSHTFDQLLYYDYSFGNPTGRAQGIGYLQELLARLRGQYINFSNSSVNSTIDKEASDFPLDGELYIDFTHDTTVVSLLTAMSMDYFKQPPGMGKFPVPTMGHFNISNIGPSGTNLVTEVISCDEDDPKPVKEANPWTTTTGSARISETGGYKFVRIGLNRGILPLDSIRGGACKSRSDGMCPIEKVLESQAHAYEMSNFDYACYGNYSALITDLISGRDWDGTIRETNGKS